MRIKSILLTVIAMAIFSYASAQKVGVVLSGGGAKGLAHVGVIRVLEENNIPIDYIAGTSMGAIVGGLYASGYSPDEMEKLLTSKEFQAWSTGKIKPKYCYYYKKPESTPSWIDVKIARIDNKLKIIPFSSIVPDSQMNIAFMELCTQANVACKNDFNNLIVPFFCIASDVQNYKQVILRKGDLGNAIRSSMTVPLYFKPIKIDSVLLYDGGIFNNFPQKEMKALFHPDIIIGHNVAGKRKELKEEDLVRQVMAMVMKPTNYSVDAKDGIYLDTDFENVELLDFQKGKFIIEEGEKTALSLIDSIKSKIKRRTNLDVVTEKRKIFNAKKPELVFNNIQVQGIDNPNQRKFIINSFKHENKTITLEELRTEYFKLLADQHLKSIRPVAIYNPQNKNFDLNLIVEPEKKVEVKIGGNVSSKPMNMGFGGVKYRFYDQYAYTLSSNFYFGRFYNSIKMGARIDIPKQKPFYFSTYATFNRWDFFSSSSDIFFKDIYTPYIVQNEFNIRTELGIPLSINSKLYGGLNFSTSGDEYYQIKEFDKVGTPDETRFNAFNVNINVENYSLNDKQYPTEGKSGAFSLKYIFGREKNFVYFNEKEENIIRANHSYFVLNAFDERYLPITDFFTLGIEGTAVYSNKKPLINYTSTKLAAPSYTPTPHSKSIYVSNFKSDRFIAGGLKSIFHINKSVHLRFEAYAFAPIFDVYAVDKKGIKSKKMFEKVYFQTMAAGVYTTNLGPASININFYEKGSPRFYVSLNFGYIIFNKRGI